LRHGASLLEFPAFLPALAAFAIGALATWNARASDEKQVCLRAVEHAQLVRLDGKLREAREGFMTCARAVCPDAIRQDCTRWVTEVDASLPTVVFEAVWADGRDVAGLTVMLDGQPLADAGAGRAVALDPGKHTFRFEAPSSAKGRRTGFSTSRSPPALPRRSWPFPRRPLLLPHRRPLLPHRRPFLPHRRRLLPHR
jgi:hypothetical protein